MSWGGNNSAVWKPEAILANGASLALNHAWQTPDVLDVIAAVPVVMINSNFRESGDGQLNATLTWNSWQQTRPPVVAALVRLKNGTSQASFFFDQALAIATNQLQISYLIHGKRKSLQVPLQVATNGKSATWTVDSDLDWGSSTQSDVIFVQPAGWADWFPIYFRHPVMATSDLLAQLRPQDQTLPGGGSALDSEKVSAQISGNSARVKDNLSGHVGHFGTGYNQAPFLAPDFHGKVPVGNGFATTGIGKGVVWVVTQPTSIFKILYMCIDKRNPADEAAKGVATGAGPHQIGIDPTPKHPGYGGTFINDLETGPLLAGIAVKSPSPDGPPSGAYAFGLKDMATIRWMMPGEGVAAPLGRSDWGYAHGKPASVVANYHWFYNHNDAKETCLQGWVSPCLPHPKNNMGLNPTQGCEQPTQ